MDTDTGYDTTQYGYGHTINPKKSRTRGYNDIIQIYASDIYDAHHTQSLRHVLFEVERKEIKSERFRYRF